MKTKDPYCPYYYRAMQNESSVCATPTEDPLFNQSSGYSSLNEQLSQGLDSSACGLSLSNSAGKTSVNCDNIRKPLIKKKRSHDQFKINLLENVKTKVDIPQYLSTTATTPNGNGGLLMPVPGYPLMKIEDPYCPYYYPTLKNDSSVCATATEDPLLNQSSLNEQLSQGLDSSAFGY
ncbi:hypothetical protein CHS0354_035747 [Potamilus streckersoni]|uniref:Uncharacterized protein n=1 Tax=Potamilus streckersoni TaxID=2493646 RepID=A0AAE0VLY3_9BIVA|nr:hypothetical protein CHS0354_035747 [Potamilus streckersoni]